MHDRESVADGRGRVWGYEDLYVDGNGVFSRRIAYNLRPSMVALLLNCAEGVAS